MGYQCGGSVCEILAKLPDRLESYPLLYKSGKPTRLWEVLLQGYNNDAIMRPVCFYENIAYEKHRYKKPKIEMGLFQKFQRVCEAYE